MVLTDDNTVHELNLAHRNVDAPTDVLSFPNHDSVDSVDLILPEELLEEEADYLGDIIIAVPYAQRQAAKANKSLQEELELLVVHGVLHLLGFDHATSAEEARMWEVQRQILETR